MPKQKAKINDKPSHVPLHHTERSASKAASREEIQTWEDEGGAERDGAQQKEPSESVADLTKANGKSDGGEGEYAADGAIERPRGRSGVVRDGKKRAAEPRADR